MINTPPLTPIQSLPETYYYREPIIYNVCVRSSEELAVKEYVRSAAGCDLSREERLRPPKVLLATVNYLIR